MNARGRKRTDVDDVASTTSIEVQRGVTCGTMLSFKLTDKLIEAGLVGDVRARELKDALSL